jgi:hypothetical protein
MDDGLTSQRSDVHRRKSPSLSIGVIVGQLLSFAHPMLMQISAWMIYAPSSAGFSPAQSAAASG